MPYIDPSIIEQVKRIDLLTYLRDNEPDELVKLSANTYATKTHDSLKISNGKWYWWSRGFGGKSALDYLIKVRDMTFLDAVQHLADRNTVPLPPPVSAVPKPPPQKHLVLPERSRSDHKAFDYLASRGISEDVIKECMGLGLVYESTYKNITNVAFVGLDTHGTPKYTAVRGIRGDYKGEAEGSDKHFPFKLTANTASSTVYVFEGAIDVLSYASILQLNGKDWRAENLLSLGGIPPKTESDSVPSIPRSITQYLKDNPHIKTAYLMLDNDEPGRHAANKIATALYGRISVHLFPSPQGKDYNDYLMSLNRNTTEKTPIESARPLKRKPQLERS